MKNIKKFIVLPLIGALLVGCKGKKHYSCADYMTSVMWHDKTKEFRVLQLSDIHFSQSDYREEHYKVIDETVSRAKADLIVLNGDCFTFADKLVVNELFDHINSYGIPWTFTFGNHDDQGYYSDTYIQRLLCDTDRFSNARFVNLEDDDVTGRSNFVINITQSYKQDPVYQIYLFDSHSYNFDDAGYDFIKQDQIDWYESMVKFSTETYGKVIPSSAYMHIAPPEFYTAWYLSQEGDPSAKLIIGSTDEYSGGPKPESDLHLFDKIKELGSTKSISAAHEHINDSVIDYQGIYLAFGVHSTNRIYRDEDKIGGQILKISPDNFSISFENIYVKY